MNKCIFIGNLTSDPVLKSTPDGTNVCTFTIAIEATDEVQDDKSKVEYIPIVSWKKQAVQSAKHLRRGFKCYVMGCWKKRRHRDNKGIFRDIVEVHLTEIKILSKETNTQQPHTATRSVEVVQERMSLIKMNEANTSRK